MERRNAGEAGLTIVEMVVAALILSMGALATFGLLSSATKNTFRAKATQVALDRAQQEVEELRSLNNSEIALTATPASSGNPLNPNYRVNSANGTFAVDRQPPGNYNKLVVNGGEVWGGTGEEAVISGGVITPGPVPFTSGDVSGEIYRYVVWRNDETCGSDCPGPQDFKQVIVAVKLDKPGNSAAERGYVEVQSDFVDPTDSASNDPAPGPGGEVVTAQQFFLSDTPCSPGGSTARQEITGDHLLHNTLGVCADGMQTGSTPGAPDALLLGAPPDPSPTDPDDPPLYDYADDTYLEPTPDTDKGLQILRDDSVGCNYVPTGSTNPEAQVHRWVTDPMAEDFVMEGRVTLEFHTRTLNDAIYPGKLCVYLFQRHEEGTPPVGADTQLTDNEGNPFWFYVPGGNGLWPRDEWKTLRLEMQFSEPPFTIPVGDRLGVALSVDPQNTPPTAIPIMYDHHLYPTRIEVETSTPIEGS